MTYDRILRINCSSSRDNIAVDITLGLPKEPTASQSTHTKNINKDIVLCRK